MRKSTKRQRSLVITGLIIVCIALISVICLSGYGNKDTEDLVENTSNLQAPVIGEINIENESLVAELSEVNAEVQVIPINPEKEVVVELIELEGKETNGHGKVEVKKIEEPMAIEPEKPDSSPPDHNPETNDDFKDTEKEPKYSEEETTYIPEQEPQPNEEPSEPSNLVPASENPFLQDNIPSNGDGGEVQGEDLGEGEWGTGDKF